MKSTGLVGDGVSLTNGINQRPANSWQRASCNEWKSITRRLKLSWVRKPDHSGNLG